MKFSGVAMLLNLQRDGKVNPVSLHNEEYATNNCQSYRPQQSFSLYYHSTRVSFQHIDIKTNYTPSHANGQ